jgi:hypothetical protein
MDESSAVCATSMGGANVKTGYGVDVTADYHNRVRRLTHDKYFPTQRMAAYRWPEKKY